MARTARWRWACDLKRGLRRDWTVKALDLFCCGGGASRGLVRAGFQVTGVDIEPFVIERGTTRDIFASPKHPYTKHLLASEPKGQPPAADPQAQTILEAKDLRVGLFKPDGQA